MKVDAYNQKNQSELKEAQKGFVQLMYGSGQLNKNFMLLVTETNRGLAYDRDVKVFPSRHFMMS